MALEVYYKRDILNAIRALYIANEAAGNESEAYHRGFNAALLSFAANFGISLDAPTKGEIRLRFADAIEANIRR